MSAARLRPRADVRFRLIAGEAVVLRQEVGETLVLNEVGARLLQLIAQGHERAELPARIAEEFAVEEEAAAADTGRFLAELLAAGVIEQVQQVEGETPCPC